MHEGLNSLNPYNIYSEQEYTYFFLTQANIPYIAYFTSSAGYFSGNPEFDQDILGFSFEPFGEFRDKIYRGTRVSKTLKQRHDERVLDSIIKILLLVFENNPSKCISIICESRDGLAKCRHRYFQQCYSRIRPMLPQRISKYDLEIEDAGYISLFIRDDHPFHQKIVECFNEIPTRVAVDKNP